MLTVNRDAVALLAGFRGGLEAGGSIDESIDALCNRSIALLELVLPVPSEDQGRRGDVNTAEMFDSAVWLALHGDFLRYRAKLGSGDEVGDLINRSMQSYKKALLSTGAAVRWALSEEQ